MQSGLFPQVHVNSQDSSFSIYNEQLKVKREVEGRKFFKCTNIQGSTLQPNILNVQFDRGVVCPQGFKIAYLHIGYSYISPLKLQKPEEPNIPYTNKQILKLCKPFILGMIIRDINNPQSLVYMQMGKTGDQLLRSVALQSFLGTIKAKHEFNTLIWKDGQINSQYQSVKFENAAFHTIIKAQDAKILKLIKPQTFDFPTSTSGETLIGIVYMKQTDLEPICIYGYSYDLLLFKYSIVNIPSNTFYYSQSVFQILNLPTQFATYVIQMIQLGFSNTRTSIPESDYSLIQQQLSLLIQGQLPIYGNNLYGKIDGLVSQICQNPNFINDPMCACMVMKYGSSCQQDVMGSQCRISGYKNTSQLQQQCVSNNNIINITDNTKVQTLNLNVEQGSTIGSLSQQ